MTILHFPNRARVFTPAYVRRLAEANRAARHLRALGCKVLRMHVEAHADSEILVDRNPHKRLADCPSVHVLVGRVQAPGLAEYLV